MPKLPTYSAPLGELPAYGGRRASADEFGAVASATGALAHSAGKVADAQLTRMEEDESRKALVASSEIRAKYAKALDEAATSGGDLVKLKEQMANELSRVGEGFQTRRGADSLNLYTANTDLMFDEQANRIEVQRAASTARLEAAKFMQSSSETIRSNPLYLGTAVQDAEALVDTFSRISPEKKAEIKLELRQNLNMAAALSSARIDPEGTKAKLEDGKWELSPEQRELAINKADTQINARRASENHARALEEHERVKRNEEASQEYTSKIVQGSLTGKALEIALSTDPRLTGATQRTLIAFAEHRANELVNGSKKSDPVAKQQAWLDVHAADDDPRKIISTKKIVDQVEAGKLNTTDADKLINDIRNQRDSNNRSIGNKLRELSINFDRAVAGDPRLSVLDAGKRAEVQNDYVARVYEQVESMRNNNDVAGLRSLFDPKDKRYVGSREFMQVSIDGAKAKLTEDTAGLPVAKTIEERNKLQPGTAYVGPDGKRAIVPERRKASNGPPTEGERRAEAQRGSRVEQFPKPTTPYVDLGS